MEFTLAHGTANDFVVLTDLDDRLELPAALVRALADRRRGLGADGVIRIGRGGEDADVFMDYRNADGSVVEMCGNGVRVVAKHVVDHDLVVPTDDGVIRVGTRAGVKPVRIVDRHADGRVATIAVDMGPPELRPEAVPFAAADPDAFRHHLEVDGEVVGFSVLSMGNPHAVLVVDDVDAAPVRRLGARLERDPSFPQGVNVGFAEVVADDQLRLRVWERGVGETAACGTGACAAVVALQRLSLLGQQVAVELPGGRLDVDHAGGGTVSMTGPAVEVAHGTLDTAWLAAAGYDSEE
ncbi:MAG: diaminopimelate epimerase [Nitriliruptor sp.]|nr:MAG: diaminopimelate epimerase [Nitriliruptor sp.]